MTILAWRLPLHCSLFLSLSFLSFSLKLCLFPPLLYKGQPQAVLVSSGFLPFFPMGVSPSLSLASLFLSWCLLHQLPKSLETRSLKNSNEHTISYSQNHLCPSPSFPSLPPSLPLFLPAFPGPSLYNARQEYKGPFPQATYTVDGRWDAFTDDCDTKWQCRQCCSRVGEPCFLRVISSFAVLAGAAVPWGPGSGRCLRELFPDLQTPFLPPFQGVWELFN